MIGLNSTSSSQLQETEITINELKNMPIDND